VSLDGVLRYLPLAALYDGSTTWSNATLSSYSHPPVNPGGKMCRSPGGRPLGWGLQGACAFPALPGVVRELQGIIREPRAGATAGVLPGTIKLDEALSS